MKKRVLSVSSIVAGAVAGVLPGGCGGPGRAILTDEQLQARASSERAATESTFDAAIERLLARIERESDAGECTVDLLALSGGGDYGAFGAGFLVGWGSVKDPAWMRPDFDAVSGVSTGALIAPFAYVGTNDTCESVEGFYKDPQGDWVLERGPLFFLPSNPSFMTIDGLERDLRKAIGPALIGQMAEASKRGKLLIVGSTDLDLGRPKCWDVGFEAEAAVAKGEPERVQRILMSSAAIPAVFPPMEIDGGLYADGGVTANVLVKLDPRRSDGLLQSWLRSRPGKPFPKVRYWVIINNQLAQAPTTVQTRWPSVISPSLSTAIRSATMAEVRWLAAQADFVNALMGTNIEVRMVAIPDDWRAPVKGDFQRETMESLAELGRRMGADPSSWKLLASPAELDRWRINSSGTPRDVGHTSQAPASTGAPDHGASGG